MDTNNHKLKIIVFKACHLAAWSDSKLTLDERRYLSHLTEALCTTEAEREAFKEIRLQDIHEESLLSEIKPLSKEEKADVFDTCLDILASDRKINLQELRLLGTLRKACDISYWSYRKKFVRTAQSTRAKITPHKIIFFILLIPIVSLVVTYTIYTANSSDPILREMCSREEISVSVLSKDSPPISKMTTAQDVFEQVRDSIVTVNLFIDYEPVCSGSGSVIGGDESGLLYVITNKHVIDNSSIKKNKRKTNSVRVEVQQPSGAKFDASLDFYSREHDLAILAIKGMKDYSKPLQLNLKSGLKVGQAIYAIGSPIGLDHSFTAGVISALRESYLQTDATVHSGSSGGPLIDQYGTLCGVVTRGHEAKDYGFALYSDNILEVLEERKERKISKSSKSSDN